MSDYLKSIAGWNSDGSLGLHWMERDMGFIPRSANGSASVRCQSPSETEARVAAVTKDADGIIIMLGDGDHSCYRRRISNSLADKLLRELFAIRVG